MRVTILIPTVFSSFALAAPIPGDLNPLGAPYDGQVPKLVEGSTAVGKHTAGLSPT